MHAENKPNQIAFTFLEDGESQEQHLTYRQLHEKACAIAAHIQSTKTPVNERALLLYPPGIDYISAFFGCLYAGIIAIPVYLPYNQDTTHKIQHIIQTAQPKLCLTTKELQKKFAQLGMLNRLTKVPLMGKLAKKFAKNLSAKALELEKCRFEQLHWLATDNAPLSLADRWQPQRITKEHIVYLQYTSGSTGNPKGVMITHENLFNNLQTMQQVLDFTPNEQIACWLPPYHDFGLIGGILQPVYHGWTSRLTSPLAFLQRPSLWLQLISRYKATVSGAPNFAYQYCINKVSDADKQNLDLSSWWYALNAAEPIRKITLDNFAKAFAPCGFQPQAMTPAYGLAESTLFVTGKKRQRRSMKNVNDTAEIKAEKNVVSCGISIETQTVHIVDPQTSNLCTDTTTGEIWLKSKSVAQGYWQDPLLTEAIFKAHLASGEGPYLRTGDLGYFKNGELFITGRLKDLIIIRGQNHYPQDIELTAEKAHPILRLGCTAAFAIEINDQETVVIVQEAKESTPSVYSAAVKSIRMAVLQQHALNPYAIILIKAKTIAKTTSGKIRRSTCRDYYQSNKLDILYA